MPRVRSESERTGTEQRLARRNEWRARPGIDQGRPHAAGTDSIECTCISSDGALLWFCMNPGPSFCFTMHMLQ